ncbi:hypothetical protein [uncultured Tateyamaria sp.]|uniref:hypothetical protein n=1 Tax=uncultured Tateyamaria sp. TaxID=455651 RepID=UPI00261B195F|nr:hypothetical protein [uncultured Tateyamaria sp.]
MPCFQLIRRSDGLIYHFAPHHRRTRCYLRADRPDLAITWEDRLGWVMRDPDDGALTGRVWSVAVSDQGAIPPARCWVTAKAGKSYVHDLRYDASEGRP